MQDETQKTSIYERLGGGQRLRQLVDRFYTYMDQLPEAKVVRDMHPEDLSSSADRLFWFLSGWSGGPALFHQHRGAPMLRARHLPFAIGKAERDQWMLCMVMAIEDVGYEEPLKGFLIESFMRVAQHMRNQEPL